MPTLRFKSALNKFALMGLAGLLLTSPAFSAVHSHAPIYPPIRRISGRSLSTPKKIVPHIPLVQDLFVKVLQADDLFSYKGRKITTYWRTGQTTAVSVLHRPSDDRRLLYLSPESQRGLLIVSNGRQEWQFDPHRKELSHRMLSPNAVEEDDFLSYTLLRANYYLVVDPLPRTYADRKVYVVSIKRPQGQTLARKFWIDVGSGLILKREIYGEDGKLVVTRAFTEISYHPKLSAELFDLSYLSKTTRTVEAPMPAEASLPLNSLSVQLAGKAFSPSNLAGYRLVGASTTMVGGKSLLHLRYSDGLNLVSLFEQKRVEARRPTVVKGMRKILIGSVPGHVAHRASLTTLNWDTATLNVTLMGEMGIGALRSLALAAIQAK